jgi:hypothetical protein
MFLEKIEDLFIDNLHYPGGLALSERHTLYTSPVASIGIAFIGLCGAAAGSANTLSIAPLKQFLEWPRQLRKLACSIPGERIFHGNNRVFIGDMRISPLTLSKNLLAVKHSLTALDIYEGVWMSPYFQHDGTRFDLSSFEALRSVRITSALVFPGPVPNSRREGMYKLLPRTLRDISV